MNRLKIFIYYNITEQPWGGGNSFLKAFKKYLITQKNQEIEIIDNIKKDYDIFFMNGGHKDQGKYIDINEIKKIKYGTFFEKLFGKKKDIKIIYRLDGARYKYNKTKSLMDELQYKALNLADYTIFQSKECVDSFKELGYHGENHCIIYNGVDQDIFNFNGKKFWDKKQNLKILSCTWSSNIHKGFEVISKFSEQADVESYYVGNWNNDVDKRKVKIIPPIKQEELAKLYKESDVFLHAAENDPCPNVVLEAMSCGLPIIYHNSGGTPEIAGKYGIPLPENITDETISQLLDNMKENYDKFVDLLKNDKEKFSIKTTAEEYISVFKKVLNR